VGWAGIHRAFCWIEDWSVKPATSSALSVAEEIVNLLAECGDLALKFSDS
jgi:hypothetical protein